MASEQSLQGIYISRNYWKQLWTVDIKDRNVDSEESIVFGGTFTFIEYYKWKYDVTIEDPSQPLLRISNARARPDMRNPVSGLDETRGGQSVDEGPESPHHTPITGRGRNGGTSDYAELDDDAD